MLTGERLESDPSLTVPNALHPTRGRALPELTAEVVEELAQAGWKTVGLMVAFADSEGNIMMLAHNGRDKNEPGALGPLGETSQCSGPIIEQPIETLFRGIQEELGIQRPAELELWMHREDGWIINQWPRGKHYPGEYACAISFPVFMADSVKEYLLSIPHGTEEVGRLVFLPPEEIFAMPDWALRPGTKDWLKQLQSADLLTPGDKAENITRVSFLQIYGASLKDIEL